MKAIKFTDLEFEPVEGRGIQALIEFDNGYEVSVVKHQFSYGGKKGMYEIGVFYNNHMVDPADWGSTVKGWLNPEDVEKEVALIQAL